MSLKQKAILKVKKKKKKQQINLSPLHYYKEDWF